MSKVIRLSEYSADMTRTDLKNLSHKLRFFAGPHTGETVGFDKSALVLGSCKNANLVLKDSSVADLHCVLAQTGTGVQITDLNTNDGTFVNGRKIQSCRLQAQDKVRIGRSQFEFQVFDLSQTEVPKHEPIRHRARGSQMEVWGTTAIVLILVSLSFFFLLKKPESFNLGRSDFSLAPNTAFFERLRYQSMELSTKVGFPHSIHQRGIGSDVGAQLALAKELFQSGQYKEAANICDSILKEEPKNKEVKDLLDASLQKYYQKADEALKSGTR